MDTTIFEEIGLTKSEIKVYLALLELGSTTKGPLIKKSEISSSKIYEVTDKLIDKGLVSYILKNKVKHFKAAPPSRIKEYVKEKKDKISKQENELAKIIPFLEKKHIFLKDKTDAEIFMGWNGLETAYQDIINNLSKGDTDYVFGASKGSDSKRTRRFFDRYLNLTYEKGIKIKAIFNKDSKDYHKSSKAKKRHVEARFLDQTTPTEINIYKDKTLIVVLSQTPLVIMIKGKEVADSFKQYFDVMWGIAKS